MTSRRPVIRNLDLSNDWLTNWGDLPTNLEDLKKWLKEQDITPEQFTGSAKWEANLERFPWLEEL